MKNLFQTIIILVCFYLGIALSFAQNTPVPLKPIDEKRVAEIVPLLSDKLAGFGQPCSQREIWDQLLQSGKYDQFLEEMKDFTFPAFSEDDYFSLSRGTAPSSSQGLNMMRNRAKGLSQATWAECLENKGKYIKVIEEGLKDILNQKSWVSPRHDFGFKNYNGIEYSVELTSALYAHTISQTLYLLGDKLTPELRKNAIDEIYKRIFNPLLNKIETQNTEPENRFLIMTNNHNHVCLAGVVGAAFTLIEDKHERAVFAYIGEYYSQNGLVGFADDGYCSEGMVYFNYGFGHFIQLRECLWQATDGKIDLFDNPKMKKIAWYPYKMEITEGVYPAISDGNSKTLPDPAIMFYVNRNFHMGIDKYEQGSFEGRTNDNRFNVMMLFPNSASQTPPTHRQLTEDEKLRSVFDLSAILIVRPQTGTYNKLGAAIKGGNNMENHNHNDVGSYTIVLGKEIMVGDPGSIPYTANIFNEKFRYTYKTVGSYGHPVPLVAGKEQRPGADAKAMILEKKFSENKDIFSIDITSAYDVPELKKLIRTMEYSREGRGEVSFVDNFEYSGPQVFETAISTRSEWVRLSDGTIQLEKNGEKMTVSFTSPGNKLQLKEEEITEGGMPYTRIGIYTEKPVKKGKIICLYKPTEPTIHYDSVEIKPLFKGRPREAFLKHIAQNTNFPKEALEKGISGIVHVSFVIDTSGNVEQIEVVKPVYSLLDKEAYRVISISPKWTPGKHNGSPVKVSMTAKVVFRIN